MESSRSANTCQSPRRPSTNIKPEKRTRIDCLPVQNLIWSFLSISSGCGRKLLCLWRPQDLAAAESGNDPSGTLYCRASDEAVKSLQGVVRGRRCRTTVSDAAASYPADLVNRQFTATCPNQLWVADFAYLAIALPFSQLPSWMPINLDTIPTGVFVPCHGIHISRFWIYIVGRAKPRLHCSTYRTSGNNSKT